MSKNLADHVNLLNTILNNLNVTGKQNVMNLSAAFNVLEQLWKDIEDLLEKLPEEEKTNS